MDVQTLSNRASEPAMNIIARTMPEGFRVSQQIDACPAAFAGMDCTIVPLRHLPHQSVSASANSGPFDVTVCELPPAMIDLRAREGRCSIIFPMTDRYGAVVNGNQMQPSHLILAHPRGRILMRDAAPTAMGCISFDASRYGWDHSSASPEVRLIDAVSLGHLRKATRAIFLAQGESGATSSFNDRLTPAARHVDWVDAMLRGAHERFFRWNFSASDALPVMERVDAFIAENRGRSIYLKEVADAAGVSMRKLHNVVVSIRGMSFTRYLKTRRLWMAYQELAGASPDKLIKSVALKNGFWHLGDFARDFSRQFGEAPSETRQRAPRAGDRDGSPADMAEWFARME